MNQVAPRPWEVWMQRDGYDLGLSPLLVIRRDPNQPRWITCDRYGQLVSLWDGTVSMYEQCKPPLYWSTPGKRRIAARKARW